MGDFSAAQPLTAAVSGAESGAVVRGALVGGLLAGAIDIVAAAIINHAPPGLILQVIASGLVGKIALHGGSAMVALGLGLQLAMSLLIAAIYGAASLRLPVLIHRPVSLGVLFGLGVFIVMNFVVAPLSAAVLPKQAPSLAAIALNLTGMVVFGLIVALTQAWASRARP